MKAIITKVQDYCVHDGPGIRTTVFFKGCDLSCWWCHNPEGLHHDVMTVNGVTYGYEIDIDDLMKQLARSIIFFDQSGGGVTFSGGDPLLQINFLMEALARCRELGIQTAVDVYPNCTFHTLSAIAPLTDLFLYDIKVMNPKKHLKYCGVPVAQPMNNLKRLGEIHNNILLRMPVIPNVNMDKDQIDRMKWLITVSENIEIFAYHSHAREKYKRLNMEYLMGDTPSPTDKEMAEFALELGYIGFNVKIS